LNQEYGSSQVEPESDILCFAARYLFLLLVIPKAKSKMRKFLSVSMEVNIDGWSAILELLWAYLQCFTTV